MMVPTFRGGGEAVVWRGMPFEERESEATSCNGLVQSWPEIHRLSHEQRAATQVEMFDKGSILEWGGSDKLCND
jgi:hypothetical protein